LRLTLLHDEKTVVVLLLTTNGKQPIKVCFPAKAMLAAGEQP
jgi:hypothetical protein